MSGNSLGYHPVDAVEVAGRICKPHRISPESLRDSTQHEMGLGAWAALVLAFIISMAWGVLVALAAEETATSKQGPTARPTRAQAGPVSGFKPVRLMYAQAEGRGFRKPAGVFVVPETGELLVSDTESNLVTLLSREGVPVFAIGFNGEIVQPTRAILDKRGRILAIASVPRKVKVFSYRGEPLGDFTFPGFDGAAQAVPTALTIDRSGNLYIADSTSGQIVIYDPEWRLVSAFGKRADGPGGFSTVTAMTVDPSGNIYVADAQHRPSIQVFDSKGVYLRGWGEHSGGPQNFSFPIGIAVDAAGRVLVADAIRQTISVFSPEGQYLFRFGGLGPGPGNLGYPAGLDMDTVGRLYVSETANARLQVFEPTAEAPAVPRRQAPARPLREQQEMRKSLTDMLKTIQK